MDALEIAPPGMMPPSLCLATAANPIDATQPQEEQSGLPPYWHGVIEVLRSADNVRVVSAKTQSLGLCGGAANCRIRPSAISSLGYFFRNSDISAITRTRSSAVNISGRRSPICGVKRLNHTLLVSGRGVQNCRNSSRYPDRFII